MAQHLTAGADYEDTIGLLQEEIARLEDEVRLRDEASPETRDTAGPGDREAERVFRRRADELSADLAGRDETIGLLQEQVSRFEAVEAASQAEWEQLDEWADEIEKRVAGRDEQCRDLRLELETERRHFEEQSRTVEAERQGWQAQRRGLEAEINRLRSKLAEVAARPESAAAAALEALEQENRKLRESCAELAEGRAFRERLQTVQNELDRFMNQYHHMVDEHQRERKEHEAALAALSGQLERETAKRQADQVIADAARQDFESPHDADERIRALRQHLREIHQSEEAARRKNRLSARLSRLWRQTGPGS